MVDFVFADPADLPVDPDTAAENYANLPPPPQSEGQQIDSDLQAFGAIVTGGMQRYGEALDAGGNGRNLPPDPILQPDAANKAYSPPGATLFTHPVAQSVARDMGKEATDQAQRDQVLAQWAQTASPARQFTVQAAAGLLDPNNIALALVPGLGEETFLAGLGKIGVTGFGARVAARAAAGASTFAAATPLSMGLQAAQTRAEGGPIQFDIRDAVRQLAMNAAVGALLHTGIGFLGRDSRASLLYGAERPRPVAGAPEAEPTTVAPKQEADAAAIARAPASTTHAAIDTAVAQTVDGRPVDVQPIFDAGAGEQPRRAATTDIPGEVGAAEAGVAPTETPIRPAETQGAPPAAGEAEPVPTQPEGAQPAPGAPPGAPLPPVEPQRAGTVAPPEGAPVAAAPALVVAREMPDGKIRYGKPGQVHADLVSKSELKKRPYFPPPTDSMGFAEPGGKFMSRAEALDYVNAKEPARAALAHEPTGLQAEKYNAQPKAPAAEPKTPQQVAADQQQIYRNGYAPGVDQNDFDATNAAVYGQERPPASLEPPPSRQPGATGSAQQAALDAKIADAERQLADSGIALTAEEKAELDKAQATVAAADKAADGYQQAGDCLTGAGV